MIIGTRALEKQFSRGCKQQTIILIFSHYPLNQICGLVFPYFFFVEILTRFQKTFQTLLNNKKSTSHFQPQDAQLNFAIQFYSQHGNTKI